MCIVPAQACNRQLFDFVVTGCGFTNNAKHQSRFFTTSFGCRPGNCHLNENRGTKPKFLRKVFVALEIHE
jgi:hypothetical protein